MGMDRLLEKNLCYMKNLSELSAEGRIEPDVLVLKLEEKFGPMTLTESIVSLIGGFVSSHSWDHNHPGLSGLIQQCARVYCAANADGTQAEFPFKTFVQHRIDTTASNRADFEKIKDKQVFWELVDYIQSKIECK